MTRGWARFVGLTQFLAVCTLAIESSARDPDNSGGSVGADVAVIQPLSSWHDSCGGPGAGVLAYGDHSVFGDLAVTVRAGYAYHLSRSVCYGNAAFRHVDLLAGLKYRFGGPYVAVEGGAVWLIWHQEPYTLTVRGSSRAVSGSDTTERGVGGTAGAGYELGDFDLRAQVLFPALSEGADFLGVMATVGFRFLDY